MWCTNAKQRPPQCHPAQQLVGGITGKAGWHATATIGREASFSIIGRRARFGVDDDSHTHFLLLSSVLV